MSNVTPPAPAGAERLIVKSNVVVPELASLAEMSLIVRLGVPHRFSAEAVLRGLGAPAVKSALLLSVSLQPPLLRESAVVALIVGAGPVPSKKFAPLVPVP